MVSPWQQGSLRYHKVIDANAQLLRRTVTDQSTEEVHGLQDQLLVSHPHHTQGQQLLVGHLQQLVSVHLLPLEGGDVLLQAVIQT